MTYSESWGNSDSEVCVLCKNDSNQLLISLTFWFFSISLKFVDLFWTDAKCQVPWFESAHDSSSISKTWIDSTHDSTGFPGIDSESTHDSSGFPRYWFRLTHDSKCFPIFYSNQLMTQAKNIWLRVDSWFDSESYPCLPMAQEVKTAFN